MTADSTEPAATPERLQGRKILVTGPAGQIARPLVEFLRQDNEVWGIARFGDSAIRDEIEELGVRTRAIDIADGEFGDLPGDFDHVVHLAAYRAPGFDYDEALRVSAEGTHLLLHHCRAARSALVMSTVEVYRPRADPWHVLEESDVLGDSNSKLYPTYSIAKIAQESVARACARSLRLPVVIPRLNASYGPNGGLLSYHLHAVLAGDPIPVRWDPAVYTPIHQEDINAQLAPMLAAASTPATIVNWGGDQTVTVAEWTAYMSELTGRPAKIVLREVPGGIRGMAASNARRLAITGPSGMTWQQGVRRLVESLAAAPAGAPAAKRASTVLQAIGQEAPTSVAAGLL